MLLTFCLFLSFCGHPVTATQPLPKDGPCPPGYSSYGKYCIPSKHAKPATPKLGPCPPGYYSYGNYCRKSK